MNKTLVRSFTLIFNP